MEKKFYLKENLTFYVNDDQLNKSLKIKSCDFTHQFHHPIYLNQQMECALVKLSNCPTQVHYLEKNLPKFNITLHFKFFDVPDFIDEPKISPNFIDTNLEYKFSIPNEDYTGRIDLLKTRLIEVQNNAFDRIKEFWLSKYTGLPYPSKDVMPWSDETMIKISNNSEFHFWSPFILAPERGKKNNFRNIITCVPGYLILSTEKQQIRKSAIVAVVYYTLNESFHKALGGSDRNFPNYKFIPAGYDNPKTPFFIWHRNIKKSYFTYKGNFSINFKIIQDDFIYERKPYVGTVYVYSDIISESYVCDQRVNILQTFLIEKHTDKDMFDVEFENLIYFPMRIQEITSITIQFRTKTGEILFYSEGSINSVLNLRPIHHI